MGDWFRRTTWTPSDAADFASHLERARGSLRKAQYLRIQALTLYEAGGARLAASALALLDQLVAECPDASQLSAAQMQRAECLAELGRFGDALDAFRSAIAARRAAPRFGNDAHLGFAELVVALSRAEFYDEAMAALAEFGVDEPFPVQQYRGAAARAMIAEHRGDRDVAATWARAALEAANRTVSPFSRHKGLGLAGSVSPDTHARLCALAVE